MEKLLSRQLFRELVFKRDGNKCVFCPKPALDAHHILERRLWPDGGYYLSNGASVCEEHHIACEQTKISLEEVRKACGITKFVLPPHLYDEVYDKWGNIILPNGQRLKGELFFDESVQKVLGEGGVLSLFTDYVKYPRTHHVPWSQSIPEDDRVISTLDNFKGNRVIVSVKMDGECLAASTKISMVDGSKKQINQIVNENLVGSCVLGVDENGNVVPSKITKVYNNGSTEEWYCVTVKTGPPRSIYCTGNHQFATDEGYVKAKHLRPGTNIKFEKKCAKLTELQKQILLGCLLGDGSLHIHHRNTAMVQVSHKQAHADYVKWTELCLGSVARGMSQYISGFGTQMLKLSTACNNEIFTQFKSMIVGGKKTVPEWVAKKLSPVSLAFWAMDDGSLAHAEGVRDRFQFSTCGFDSASCDVLVSALEFLGVKSKKFNSNGYWYIYVTADGTEKLAELIAPYVPPVMQYKLPVAFRGHSPKLFEDNKEIYRYTNNVEVISVVKKSHRVNRIKYDLETETHNYFANGILVHNCTSMYTDHIHARSINSGSHPSRSWVKQLWNTIRGDIPKGWRICGENLYAEHSISYTDLDSYFLGFSIWTDKNVCLSWDETMDYFKLLDIIPVPVLYDGIYDEKMIRSLFDDSKGDKMEGYVIRVADGFSYSDFKFKVAKFVRANHVQTVKHWMHGQPVKKNGLKK